MKKLNFLLKLFVGVLILSFLLFKFGFKNILSDIISINPIFIVLIFIILTISLILNGLNLKILIHPFNKRLTISKLFYYGSLSWAVGMFVPAKLGEFSIIPLLKKHDIEIGTGTSISVLDKLVTFITLSIISIIGFLFFLPLKETMILISAILVLLSIFIFLFISEIGRRLIKRFILKKFAVNFKGFSKTMFYFFKKQKSLLLLNFIITFLKWFMTSFMVYIIFLAYKQNISILSVFLINSMLMVISLIPISISGLGIRESVSVVLFNYLNINPEITLSSYILILIVTYITALIILLSGLNEIKSFMSLKNKTIILK